MRFTFTSTRMAGIKRVTARGSKDEDQSGPHTVCTDLSGARAAVENSADALEVLQLLKMLGFPVAQRVNSLPAVQETRVRPLGQGDSSLFQKC